MGVLTGRGRSLLAAAGGLWLASRVFGAPELAMAAVAAAVLVVLAVAFAVTVPSRLHVHRHVQAARLFDGQRTTVELRIANAGRLTTPTLLVDDAAPATLATTSRVVLAPVAPGVTVTVSYPLVGRRRGRYTLGPATVELQDPFALATRRATYDVTDEVVVYPPVWDLPGDPVLTGGRGTGGRRRRAPLATGDEPASVREYVRGDDLRKIHWRSTARRGKLVVRQDEGVSDRSAAVVLDTRAAAHGGAGASSTFETAVAAAASVVHHLARRGFAPRLHTAPPTRTPAATSWHALLELLATVEPRPGGALSPMLHAATTGPGGAGLLVAVVAAPSPGDLRTLVRAGRGCSGRVAVLVAPGGGGQEAPARGAADRLRAAGWRAVVLPAGGRLPDVWGGLRRRRRVGVGR